MERRTYTFHSIELQIGMSNAVACQLFEEWLVFRFKRIDDVFEDGTLHCVNSIDFRGKPHMAYEFTGFDGSKNYINMCGENPSDLRECLLKFMELSSPQYVEHTQDTIKW